MSKEKHTCCAKINTGSMHYPRTEQCGCKASIEREGQWYCKRHDPVAIKAKYDARRAQWKLEWEKSKKEQRLKDAAPDMLAAIKAVLSPLELCHAYGWPDRDGVIRRLKAAIAKAEGTENDQPDTQ